VKAQLAKIDEQVTELERSVGIGHDRPTRPAFKCEILLSVLEVFWGTVLGGYFPDVDAEFRDASNDDCRQLWPRWEAFKFVSDVMDIAAFPVSLEAFAAELIEAEHQWARVHVGDGEQVENWQTFNECSLYALKYAATRSRTLSRSFDRRCHHPKYILPRVDLAPILARVTDLPTWHRDFPADRSTWPADVRDEVESLLSDGACLTPGYVAKETFDLHDVFYYRRRAWSKGEWPKDIDRLGAVVGGLFRWNIPPDDETRPDDETPELSQLAIDIDRPMRQW
jgi:hypothetical protein